jgi:Helicase conserved C-terminal domain
MSEQPVDVPYYVIDPSRAFPEVPSSPQSTRDATRPVSSLAIFVAYLLSGNKLRGTYADTPMEQINKEIQFACLKYNVDPDRLFDWAQDLLLDNSATLSDEDREKFVPKFIKGKNFYLREYQHKRAAWAACRLGCILALGCGLGKSGTATAAAIGAVRSGKAKNTRCHILAPVNAMPQWKPYMIDLKEVFEEVLVLSIDSAHNYRNIPQNLGGVVIFDELHKLKSDDSRRGEACEKMRNAYEWACGLTGTLFHAGAEGLLRVQDIVLPGLSRFLNKWSFGDAFNCIYEKQVGKRTKRSIAMPSDKDFGRFTLYMSRGVASLSFDSPEVKDTIQMPGRNSITADSWEMPDWARELQITIAKADSRNQLYWAPDWTTNTNTVTYMGAVALAEAEKHPDKELPSFAKVMHIVCKEGRVGRILSKVYYPGKKEATFSWVLAPGFDGLSPETTPAGPKIDAVAQWLDENPNESVILSSVGNLGMYMLARLLEKRKIDYRCIRGGVDEAERNEIVNDFEAGKFPVCLLQQAAGAESITLVKATTSILIDHNWSSAIYTQFTARNYRIGQTEFCEHYDYVFGSMQAHVVKRLKRGEMFDSRVREQLESEYWDRMEINKLKE